MTESLQKVAYYCLLKVSSKIKNPRFHWLLMKIGTRLDRQQTHCGIPDLQRVTTDILTSDDSLMTFPSTVWHPSKLKTPRHSRFAEAARPLKFMRHLVL